MTIAIKSRPILALMMVIGAGFVLRLVDIGRWPLWGDEGLTLLIAQWPIRTLFLVPVDPTPGLYYALHKLLLGPMVDAAQARYISLACGTLLIPAVYVLAKKTRVPALLSASLVALSFPLIDYSQEARAYALLVLLVTLSAIYFVFWARSRALWRMLMALLFAILSLYTHLVAIFWVGPMCVAILGLGRRQAILPLLLFAVLSVPELWRIAHFPDDGFVWLAQASPAQASDTLARALLPFRLTGAWAAFIMLILGWRGWAHRGRIAEWAKSNRASAYMLVITISSPLLIWLFGFTIHPIFMTRTILLAIPGFMMGLALLLRFEHRLARFGVVGLYGVSLLVTGTTREKDDWREIAERVGNDTVLLCQLWQASAMRHALERDNRLLLRTEEGLVEVWGVPWQRTYFAILSSKQMVGEAKRRSNSADVDSYPVWPVQTGRIELMAEKPTTLRKAISYCDSVQLADREPRYIAE